MQNVIIDTDVAIDFLRGHNYAKELLMQLFRGDAVHLSILSVYELHAAMRDSEKTKTQDFIHACNLELITIEIAVKAGELKKQHQKKGITLTLTDCLIAATAIIRECKIATGNVTHYPDKALLLKIDCSR